MVEGCFKYDQGLGACPCACPTTDEAPGGFDWFKVAVVVGLIAIIAKRTSKF